MFKNLLIFLFSFFLLFSCSNSKKNNKEVISEPTDEEVAMNIYAEAVEALGLKPKIFKGNAQNFKITYSEDLVRAQNALNIIKEGGL